MSDSDILYLIKGDDTDFANNIAMSVTLTTTDDLTGWSARFQVGNVIKDFSDITSKLLNIVITKSDTEMLNLGLNKGALKLFDTNGKSITVLQDIKFVVDSKKVLNK